jgi:beta-N-acetylhexosaminidase
MNATLRGSVMLDVEGLKLNADDKRRLAHPLTGAVILFARNFQSRQQLVALVREIRAVKSELLIAVDHEGGRVQRFKTDGFTHLPAMAQLGQLWRQKSRGSTAQLHAMQYATAIGYVLAAELRACDIDFSFTPVLDLDWGRSEVIGNRAFDADARTVTLLAKQVCHGLALAGMKSCGKHFPGHGWAEADSHVDIPIDERPLKTLLAHDAAPYAWFGLGLDAVMPAHVIYPKVDAQPAGFSSQWIQNILRRQLGFRGAVFSDDLAMAGARVAGNVVQAAHAALNAGCDMVLICNQAQQADALLDGLRHEPALESARRIDALMPTMPALSWEQLMTEERYLQARELLQNMQR